MIRILIDSEELDLPAGFSLSIEDTSPIYNDRGSQSISANVPATPKNKRLLGFPNRLDPKYGPSDRCPSCMVQSGAYIRSGKLNITGANSQSIELNIGFDNSLAYEEWKSKKLTDLGNLPVREYTSVYELWSELLRIYRGPGTYMEGETPDSQKYDLAIFPICLSQEKYRPQTADGEEEKELIHSEILNASLSYSGDKAPFGGNVTVERVVDNQLATVNVPDGYGLSPFVRTWRVLELIFADLGLQMDFNPLKEDRDLSRLVVLNNTADAVCTMKISYAELMPDCTVEEFLTSLWVRFGLTFTTDFDRKTVAVKLIRDIVSVSPETDLEQYLTEEPEIEFEQRKYLSLTAGTSIEGAAPYTERLEDFLQGFKLQDIAQDKDWRGVSAYFAGRDDTMDLIWHEYCGIWYRDKRMESWAETATSSSFFNWDPQPKGLAEEAMSSPDEQVPIDRSGMPQFLTGARHLHSYIEGESPDRGEDCPLSFMFAFTDHVSQGQNTIGRLGPDSRMDGLTQGVQFRDGSTHKTSLFFQLANGLFALFWKDYDLILRHTGQTVRARVRMKCTDLMEIDMLTPVKIRGLHALPDTIEYTLSDGVYATAEMTLRPVMMQGDCDERSEQGIPAFPPGYS